MQDAITTLINSSDVQGKYLDADSLEKLQSYFESGQLRARTAVTISSNASSIVTKAVAKSLLYTDIIGPGGNMYTCRTVNVRGLRGVIPEDVTEATAVAIKDMKWKSLTYFKEDSEATAIIQQHFDVLVTEYLADKPASQLRVGVSRHQQGLQLPQSYFIAAETRPKLVMKSCLPEAEKKEAINAVYRQVFERDITATYGFARDVLESQVKSGNISMKEFVRALGKSKLYLRLFYEPFVISRVVELAMRHLLGRGLISREEFQQYFSIISAGGLPALIDALVDSQEYSDYFGEETVPYLRGLGQEAQECRNWGAQLDLFKYSAPVRKVPQFVTLFGNYEQPLLNQHPYGAGNDP